MHKKYNKTASAQCLCSFTICLQLIFVLKHYFRLAEKMKHELFHSSLCNKLRVLLVALWMASSVVMSFSKLWANVCQIDQGSTLPFQWPCSLPFPVLVEDSCLEKCITNLT